MHLVHKALKKVAICFLSTPEHMENLTFLLEKSSQCKSFNWLLYDFQDLDRNSLHARMKITVPQDPDFATSHRANRIRLAPRH